MVRITPWNQTNRPPDTPRESASSRAGISSFLIAGLLMTGHAILTPLLMVIVMIAGDFLAMSITTDNVQPSPISNTWRIGNLTIAGIVLGVGQLAFCTGVLAASKFGERNFFFFFFKKKKKKSQATIYAIRERQHLWRSGPSVWLAVSSAVDIPIASILAIDGIAMSPLPLLVVAATIAASVAFSLVSDLIKVPVFARLGITWLGHHIGPPLAHQLADHFIRQRRAC